MPVGVFSRCFYVAMTLRRRMRSGTFPTGPKIPIPKFPMPILTGPLPRISQSNVETINATVRIACSFAKCLPGHIFQPAPYGIHDPSYPLVQNSAESPSTFRKRPGEKISTGGAFQEWPLHQTAGSMWPGVELARVTLPLGISHSLMWTSFWATRTKKPWPLNRKVSAYTACRSGCRSRRCTSNCNASFEMVHD